MHRSICIYDHMYKRTRYDNSNFHKWRVYGINPRTKSLWVQTGRFPLDLGTPPLNIKNSDWVKALNFQILNLWIGRNVRIRKAQTRHRGAMLLRLAEASLRPTREPRIWISEGLTRSGLLIVRGGFPLNEVDPSKIWTLDPQFCGFSGPPSQGRSESPGWQRAAEPGRSEDPKWRRDAERLLSDRQERRNTREQRATESRPAWYTIIESNII